MRIETSRVFRIWFDNLTSRGVNFHFSKMYLTNVSFDLYEVLSDYNDQIKGSVSEKEFIEGFIVYIRKKDLVIPIYVDRDDAFPSVCFVSENGVLEAKFENEHIICNIHEGEDNGF